MAELREVHRSGLVSLTAGELGLLIHSLALGKKQCGLEGKKPVTVDGLKQDLIDAYNEVSGEMWTE